MNRAEMIDFMNANPVCSLATVEDGRPRVRIIMAYKADEQGLLFHTGGFKALHRQLQRNPAVELCFHKPGSMAQLRVCGDAEPVTDTAVLDEILAARPFLKRVGDDGAYNGLMVYRVRNMAANEWNMAVNQKPTEFKPF